MIDSSNYRRQEILDQLSDQLASVRAMRPFEQSIVATQALLWKEAGLDPKYKVSGLKTGEPSFTRLFSHKTWDNYNGVSPSKRWSRIVLTWRFSTVLQSVCPICFVATLWAFLIASIPAGFLPRMSPIPMSLMGTALGLLLVFRTNNSYQRLAEARNLWGRTIGLCREVAQGVATALLFSDDIPAREKAWEASAKVCRYLAAFAWELNAKLTYSPKPGQGTDVLKVLLSPAEVEWFSVQRSRPLQLLGALRREIHGQYTQGNLPPHLHRKLEEDVRELDLVVGACERLFSSPVPPTMSRHVVRCLVLWLIGLPLVLVGTMGPIPSSIWVFVTSYIFVGIEAVGVQVEQPFEIVPMTQLCNIIQYNLEEAFAMPP